MTSLRQRLLWAGAAIVLVLSVSTILVARRAILQFQALLVSQAMDEQALIISTIEDEYRSEYYMAELEGKSTLWSAPEALYLVGASTLLSGSSVQINDMGNGGDSNGPIGHSDLSAGRLPPEIISALDRSMVSGRNYLWYGEGPSRTLVISEVLTLGAAGYGITLWKSWGPVVQLVRGLWVSLGVAVAAALAVAGIGLLMVTRSVSGPIGRLSDQVTRIAAGAYETRCPQTRTRELVPLIDQFNLMAATIEANVMALRTQADQRQRFAENLTHEIGTPLTAIKGMALLLQGGELNDSQTHDAAASIVRSANRLELLQHRLFDLMGASRSGPLAQFEVKTVQSAVTETLAELPGATGTNLVWIPDAGQAYGQPELIAAAVTNLVRNAIAASPSGTTVTVTMEQSGGQQYVCVQDEGPGVPDEHLTRILEPFAQVNHGASSAGPGGRETDSRSLGLGLALCNEIASYHGGTLTLANRAPHGLIARVAYPVRTG